MHWKGLIKIGLLMGLMALTAGLALADHPGSKDIQTRIATADLSGVSPSASMTVNLRNLADTSNVSALTWKTGAGAGEVNVGVTDWMIADALIKVTTNWTAGGIQIYTDNTETGASPRWNGGGDPCGLLKVIPGQSTSTVRLPLCWRIMDNTTDYTHLEIKQTIASDIGGANHLRCPAYGDPATTNYNCWFWMMDEGTSGFSNGDDYVTFLTKDKGYHHAESPLDWLIGGSPYYVYVGAKFQSAAAGETYQTTKLKLELYIE